MDFSSIKDKRAILKKILIDGRLGGMDKQDILSDLGSRLGEDSTPVVEEARPEQVERAFSNAKWEIDRYMAGNIKNTIDTKEASTKLVRIVIAQGFSKQFFEKTLLFDTLEQIYVIEETGHLTEMSFGRHLDSAVNAYNTL